MSEYLSRGHINQRRRGAFGGKEGKKENSFSLQVSPRISLKSTLWWNSRRIRFSLSPSLYEMGVRFVETNLLFSSPNSGRAPNSPTRKKKYCKWVLSPSSPKMVSEDGIGNIGSENHFSTSPLTRASNCFSYVKVRWKTKTLLFFSMQSDKKERNPNNFPHKCIHPPEPFVVFFHCCLKTHGAFCETCPAHDFPSPPLSLDRGTLPPLLNPYPSP